MATRPKKSESGYYDRSPCPMSVRQCPTSKRKIEKKKKVKGGEWYNTPQPGESSSQLRDLKSHLRRLRRRRCRRRCPPLRLLRFYRCRGRRGRQWCCTRVRGVALLRRRCALRGRGCRCSCALGRGLP